MLVSFDEIEDISGRTRFFTVRLGNEHITEFEKFYGKEFPNHIFERNRIYATIEEIEARGARHYFFREEGVGEALPPKNLPASVLAANKKDFGIRLYCKVVSEDLVVLFNGDIKTKRNPRDCENVRDHFLRAQKISKQIEDALDEGLINFDSNNPFLETEINI